MLPLYYALGMPVVWIVSAAWSTVPSINVTVRTPRYVDISDRFTDCVHGRLVQQHRSVMHSAVCLIHNSTHQKPHGPAVLLPVVLEYSVLPGPLMHHNYCTYLSTSEVLDL